MPYGISKKVFRSIGCFGAQSKWKYRAVASKNKRCMWVHWSVGDYILISFIALLLCLFFLRFACFPTISTRNTIRVPTFVHGTLECIGKHRHSQSCHAFSLFSLQDCDFLN